MPKKYLTLLIIVLLAAILRLYKLGDLPRGLYVDEVSIGYNAWSIATTGKDEFGRTLPLAFQAFGEYKLPVYIYGSVPFIALFGLNAFSVRILSAVAGIISVLGMYLLTKSIFPHHTKKEIIAQVSALLFAIVPWSVHFSRGGFESNLALCFIIFGSYYFFAYVATQNKPHQLAVSVILFILALYTYNAARMFLPLYLTILVIIFSQELFKVKDKALPLVSGGIIIATIVFSLIGSLIGPESARAAQVVELGNKQYALGPFLGVLEKYLTHFSADFLFFSGDIMTRHSVRELGELYLPQLPFLVVGIYISLKKRSKFTLSLLVWLLLAPLPAAIATPVPHALRALLLLPPLIIMTAVGIIEMYEWLKRHTKIPAVKLAYPATLLLLFSFSLLTYVHVYFKHYVYKTSWDWGEAETLLGQALATQYPTPQHVFIESPTTNFIYIKFFNATQGRTTDLTKYQFFSSLDEISPQDGDIVAVSGWKGAPEQLTNVQELKMLNNSIGYKVGEWRNNE